MEMKGLTGKGKESSFGKYKEKTNNVWRHQHVRCKCHQEKCFGELPFSTYCTVMPRLRSTQHFSNDWRIRHSDEKKKNKTKSTSKTLQDRLM